MSPFEKLTRAEALKALPQVVDTDPQIAYEETAAREQEGDLFVIDRATTRRQARSRARHVVFAIGYYDHEPVTPGEDLLHVHHYYSSRTIYRQRVVIVGGGIPPRKRRWEVSRRRARHAGASRGGVEFTIKYWVRPDIGTGSRRVGRRPLQFLRARFATAVVVTGRTDGQGTTSKFRGCGVPATGYRADSA